MNLPPKLSTVYRPNYLVLRALGYDVIPLVDKSTPKFGWQTQHNDPADIAQWRGFAAGVRLYGTDLFAIDMDVTDAGVRDAQLKVLETHWPAFMASCLRRHSGAIKLMLIGRCREGTRMRCTHRFLVAPDSTETNRVEVFSGGCKRYIAVHGRHSMVAGVERLYGYDGRSITQVPAAELPEFPPHEVWDMVNTLEAVMIERGLLMAPGGGRMDGKQPLYVYDLRPEQVFQLKDGSEVTIAELEAMVRTSGKEEGYARIWDAKSNCNDRIKCNQSGQGLSLWDSDTDIRHRLTSRQPVDPVAFNAAMEAAAAASVSKTPGDDAAVRAVLNAGPITGEMLSPGIFGQQQWPSCNSKGVPRPAVRNAEAALVRYGIKCRKNMFLGRAVLSRTDGTEPDYCGPVSDDSVALLRRRLSEQHGIDFSLSHFHEAVDGLAQEHRYNPVVDMLAAAQAAWDGVARLDRLVEIVGAEDTELNRACLRKVLIALVARARRPGCKFDTILVLEGDENLGKSMFWEVLAGGPEFFSDKSILGADAKVVQEDLADVWLHENADLAGISKAEVETVKAFASRTHDRGRKSYGRVSVSQPRHSIEVGSTNDTTYLQSQTGNRRFWPVAVGQSIDIERLKLERQQLLGEAAYWESQGESLVLDEHLWAAARREQEERRVVPAIEIHLEVFLARTDMGCGIEVINGERFIPSETLFSFLHTRHGVSGAQASDTRAIARAMRNLGWVAARRVSGGVRQRGYVPKQK